MSLDFTKFLDIEEISACSQYADKRAKTSKNFRVNRVVFRLSCCCGLRTCEIHGLNLGDVTSEGGKPFIHIRKDNTKGKNGVYHDRVIPLNWDASTLAVIAQWKLQRLADGATKDDPFVCSERKGYLGARLAKPKLAMRWASVLKCLPEPRRISIHKGRHSFATHALAVGRSLVEVQRALGHASINSTNVYLHLVPRSNVPDVFCGF